MDLAVCQAKLMGLRCQWRQEALGLGPPPAGRSPF